VAASARDIYIRPGHGKASRQHNAHLVQDRAMASWTYVVVESVSAQGKGAQGHVAGVHGLEGNALLVAVEVAL